MVQGPESFILESTMQRDMFIVHAAMNNNKNSFINLSDLKMVRKG